MFPTGLTQQILKMVNVYNVFSKYVSEKLGQGVENIEASPFVYLQSKYLYYNAFNVYCRELVPGTVSLL